MSAVLRHSHPPGGVPTPQLCRGPTPYANLRHGGGGRRDRYRVHMQHTMLALGLVLNAVGIGLFDRRIFTLAVYALPFLRRLMPAFWPSTQAPACSACRQLPSRPRHIALRSFEIAFAMRRSLTLRVIIAAVFALPATFAGYHAVPAMARIGVLSLAWREVFAWVGAIFIGGTACMRLAVFTEPQPVEPDGAVGNPPQSVLAAVKREG